MKISLGWIAEWVDLSGEAPERLAELLSLHTAEVEGVEHTGAAIADVLVGEVVECGRHPDADKLSVTRVTVGSGEPVPVVCGASNVRAGLKIAFAPVGSRLPGDLKIKKAKLRGQVSEGMICSTRELELGDDHSGILELPADAPLGVPLVEYLGLRDAVLELDNKSLTHRPDLWGHYGFARELAAILERPLAPLTVGAWPDAASRWQVELADAQGCPHYLALEIELDGPPRESPAWLQQRLRAVGQRPVNDIVDLTNYLLQETGQPTHAFDADTLRGGKVVVRAARSGERITTLDGSVRTLEESDLVIADAERALALAGVMGGAETEVGATTTRILLESAVFQPVRVRRTALRLGLRTEASTRFEKSLDPALARQALERFVSLLARLRPEARILSAPAAAGAAAAPQRELLLDPERAAQRLGVDLDRDAARGILERLGFGVRDAEQGGLAIRVPSWRATKDVTLPVDLEEELGRIHGYHRIRPQPLQAPVVPPQQFPGRLLGRRLLGRMVGAHGAHETQAYSFLDRDWARRLGLETEAFVQVGNAMQKGVDLMRRDPVPSLLDQAVGNLRARPEGRLCELAKGYEPGPGVEPIERRWLALLAWAPEDAPLQGRDSLFGALRSAAEDLLRIALPGGGVVATAGAARPWAHPVHALTWRHAEHAVAEAARIHPALAAELDAPRVRLGALLLDLDALLAVGDGATSGFRSPSRYPGIKLDVALAMPTATPYAEVEAMLRRAGGKLLAELELFDVFEGAPLAAGQRSLAFRILLQADDRTLGDAEEQALLGRVAKAAEALGGALRS